MQSNNLKRFALARRDISNDKRFIYRIDTDSVENPLMHPTFPKFVADMCAKKQQLQHNWRNNNTNNIETLLHLNTIRLFCRNEGRT